MAQKISIAIFTCDAYKDLWKANLFFVRKNFPNCLLEKVFLITDIEPSKDDLPQNDNDFYDIIVSESKDKQNFFGKMNPLLQKLNTDYFLFFLDDYFLTRKIDDKLIETIIDFIENKKIDYFKLNLRSKKRCLKSLKFNGVKFYQLNTNIRYAIDLYPSIWRKEFVQQTILKWPYKEQNIWNYEARFNNLKEKMDITNSYCLGSKKDFYFDDMVRKGELIRKSHYSVLKKYKIDLSQTRKVRSIKKEICNNISNYIIVWTPNFLLECYRNRKIKKGTNKF